MVLNTGLFFTHFLESFFIDKTQWWSLMPITGHYSGHNIGFYSGHYRGLSLGRKSVGHESSAEADRVL